MITNFTQTFKTILALVMLLPLTMLLKAQPATSDKNVHHDPMVMQPGYLAPEGDAAMAQVVTIGDYDNFKLGVDFAECSIANNPKNPLQYYAVWNSTGSAGGKGYYTNDGFTWTAGNPTWNQMWGDVVVAYDSLGNLAYQNMYGASTIQGVKVAMSSNNGQTWSTPVTANPGVDKNWIAADQTAGPFANTITGVMTANSGGSVSRSTNNGVSWQSSPNLSPQNLPGMSVCIGPKGSTQGGAQYVVTNSGSSFNANYTFFESNDGGATFQQRSSQMFANTVGTQVNGRNAVLNMRTRPYPNIAADNSYGPHRGRLYLVYASNNPAGNANKPDIFCRYSDNGGTTWSSAVVVNDDPNSAGNHNWFPAIWCEKNTGRLYISWMDTRDCPTSDSAMIYATYTDDGVNFAINQQISNKKMKINCTSCGGGGTPMYLGDYNGVAANEQGSMMAWTDFRDGNFGSYVSYFPDYAMRATLVNNDTLIDSLALSLEVPSVKLYTNTVEFSASVEPVPTAGSFEFFFPDGNMLSSYPSSLEMFVVKQGAVPPGTYLLTVTAKGPNGSPIHKRTQFFKVVNSAPSASFAANNTGICVGTTADFTDQSSGAPNAWEWTFQGGQPSTSTQQNPTGILYAATGAYDVTLKVTNNYGTNTITKTAYITVSNPPAAPTTSDASVCAGSAIPSLTATGTEIRWYTDSNLSNQAGSGNTLNTGQTQPGSYTYYVTQSTVGCQGPSATATLTIHPKPVATLADFDSTCSAYPAFELVNGTPSGGTYSGTGVLDNTFSPSTAGVGTHEITYIYMDANSCSDTATNTIKVNESPVTSLTAFNPLCANAAAFALTGGLPEGGTYAGTGVSNGMFDPAVAGAGDHIISYTTAPVNGCDGYAEQVITVYPLPVVDLGADTSVCANHTFTLDASSANAASYLWAPGGATSSSIVVDTTGIGIGSQTFTVTATSDKNCVSTDEFVLSFKDCTGIDEFAKALNLAIYPNPSKGVFVIEFNTQKPYSIDLSVANALGKQVYKDEKVNVNGSKRYILDLASQADGVYVLYIKDAESSVSRKIVIRK